MRKSVDAPTPVGPVLLLIAGMTSIQVGAALAKSLFPVLGAVGTTTLRLFFASLLLSLAWRPWRLRLSQRQRVSVVMYGAALGGMNFLFYLALERIPLGIAVALEFTGPLAVAILASRRVADLGFAGLAALGIGLLSPLAGGSPVWDTLGVLCALGAGVCWALYIVYGQKAGEAVSGGMTTAAGMAVAATLVIPMGIATAGPKLLDLTVLPLALCVAVLSSAVPYSLEMVALKRLPARQFAILMSLEPLIATLSGRIFLHERLVATQWVAIACIVVASFGCTLQRREAKS